MSETILLALTNPVAGRDAEYNDWYEHTHLADVLRIPGITWAQRFKVVPGQGALPLNYLAIYGVSDDKAAVAGLASRRGTPLMAMTDALDGEVTKTVMSKSGAGRVTPTGAPEAPPNGFDRYVAILDDVPLTDTAFDARVAGSVLTALAGTAGVAAAQYWTLASHQTRPVTDKRVMIVDLYDRPAASAKVARLIREIGRPIDLAAFYVPMGTRHQVM